MFLSTEPASKESVLLLADSLNFIKIIFSQILLIEQIYFQHFQSAKSEQSARIKIFKSIIIQKKDCTFRNSPSFHFQILLFSSIHIDTNFDVFANHPFSWVSFISPEFDSPICSVHSKFSFNTSFTFSNSYFRRERNVKRFS